MALVGENGAESVAFDRGGYVVSMKDLDTFVGRIRQIADDVIKKAEDD